MLSSVSQTAIVTLKSRVVESKKGLNNFYDEKGIEVYNSLVEGIRNGSYNPGQKGSESQSHIINKKTPSSLTRHIALRGRKYDDYCREFLESHPDGLIVSLGCGLDTRFYRLGLDTSQYIELDLPEMIEIKGTLLGDDLTYTTIGKSVLDDTWLQEVADRQSTNILFIAEGLLMYLHEEDVIDLLKRMAETFDHCQAIIEVINKKYTTGLNKKMVEMKMKKKFRQRCWFIL